MFGRALNDMKNYMNEDVKFEMTNINDYTSWSKHFDNIHSIIYPSIKHAVHS